MNGFDDLERQLRGKVSARAGRRRRPLMRTLAVAAALSVSAGAVTAAATGVIGGPGTEEAGVALFNDVIRDTQDVPVCRPTARTAGPPRSQRCRRATPHGAHFPRCAGPPPRTSAGSPAAMGA